MGFGFDHIALSVSDMERSVLFYTEILGFKEYKKGEKGERQIVVLEGHGMKLELFSIQGNTGLPEARSSLDSDLLCLGTKHFALRSNDFDADIQNLLDAGVELDRGPKDGTLVSRYAFFKDPDGILFEIVEL